MNSQNFLFHFQAEFRYCCSERCSTLEHWQTKRSSSFTSAQGTVVVSNCKDTILNFQSSPQLHKHHEKQTLGKIIWLNLLVKYHNNTFERTTENFILFFPTGVKGNRVKQDGYILQRLFLFTQRFQIFLCQSDTFKCMWLEKTVLIISLHVPKKDRIMHCKNSFVIFVIKDK